MRTSVLMSLACLPFFTLAEITAAPPRATGMATAPAAQAQSIALTVYNGDFGIVREKRTMSVDEDGRVLFTDVAAKIDPTTVKLRSLTDPNTKLLEQNFQYDLVNADRLLQKYLDQPIEVVAGDMTHRGKLQSFDEQNLILLADDGLRIIRRPDNLRDIRLGKLPEGLLTRPTLLWLVDTQRAGDQLVEVTYQTGSINWHAEYVLVMGQEDKTADLSGWVSVDNRSGKTYHNAKLKFIAGDVRRILPPREMYQPRGFIAGKAIQMPMEEKPFFEYHMYTLPRPSTVADNETKQLEMFPPARGVSVVKRYLYFPLSQMGIVPGGRYTDQAYGAENVSDKVSIYIEFKNSQANKLGIPLPAGKVRVYKQDEADEALEFVGEEQIGHKPKDEELSLQVGNAFDIVGQRRQMDFSLETGRKTMEESIEIKLRNHKDQDVVVRVKEPMYRWLTWQITKESTKHIKLDARTAAWDLPVKADGETVLTYTVEYTW